MRIQLYRNACLKSITPSHGSRANTSRIKSVFFVKWEASLNTDPFFFPKSIRYRQVQAENLHRDTSTAFLACCTCAADQELVRALAFRMQYPLLMHAIEHRSFVSALHISFVQFMQYLNHSLLCFSVLVLCLGLLWLGSVQVRSVQA